MLDSKHAGRTRKEEARTVVRSNAFASVTACVPDRRRSSTTAKMCMRAHADVYSTANLRERTGTVQCVRGSHRQTREFLELPGEKFGTRSLPALCLHVDTVLRQTGRLVLLLHIRPRPRCVCACVPSWLWAGTRPGWDFIMDRNGAYRGPCVVPPPSGGGCFSLLHCS